jgi:hypothetical protein
MEAYVGDWLISSRTAEGRPLERQGEADSFDEWTVLATLRGELVALSKSEILSGVARTEPRRLARRNPARHARQVSEPAARWAWGGDDGPRRTTPVLGQSHGGPADDLVPPGGNAVLRRWARDPGEFACEAAWSALHRPDTAIPGFCGPNV